MRNSFARQKGLAAPRVLRELAELLFGFIGYANGHR
jgi:hypothetical protein